MDAVTYPHPAVTNELEHWVERKVDVSQIPDVARAFDVPAVPVAVAVAPDGTILDRRVGFVEPEEFAEWLRSVRGMTGAGERAADLGGEQHEERGDQ